MSIKIGKYNIVDGKQGFTELDFPILNFEEKEELKKDIQRGLKQEHAYYVSLNYKDCQQALENMNEKYPHMIGKEKAVRIKTGILTIWSGNTGFELSLSKLYNILIKQG